MTELDRLKAQCEEARKVADYLCSPCNLGHQYHLADVMEKHVFTAGQADGKAQVQTNVQALADALEESMKCLSGCVLIRNRDWTETTLHVVAETIGKARAALDAARKAGLLTETP